MRDTFVVWAALGVAGIAIAAGLTVGAVGGAFSSDADYVAPPALQSSDSSGSAAGAPTLTSDPIVVPPSPTWAVAGPAVPKVTTGAYPSDSGDSAVLPSTPTKPTTTSRAPRNRATTTKSLSSAATP